VRPQPLAAPSLQQLYRPVPVEDSAAVDPCSGARPFAGGPRTEEEQEPVTWAHSILGTPPKGTAEDEGARQPAATSLPAPSVSAPSIPIGSCTVKVASTRKKMHPPASRRSESFQQLQELEKRVHEFVQEQAQLPCSAKVCRRADEVALELGMNSFKSNMAWYTKFIKRHTGNSKSSAPKNGKDRGQAKQSEGRPAKEGVVGGGLMQRPSSAAGAGGDAREAPSEPPAAAESEHSQQMAAIPVTAPLVQNQGTGAGGELPSRLQQSCSMGVQQAPVLTLPSSAGAGPGLPQMQPQPTHDSWGALLSASNWAHAQALHPGSMPLAMHGMPIAQQMQRQQVLQALQQQQHQQQHQHQHQHQHGSMAHWNHAAAAAHPMQQHVAPMHVGLGGGLAGLDAAAREGMQQGEDSRCSINIKAVLKAPTPSTAPAVMRRLRVNLDLDASGIPVSGFELVTQLLTTAFKEELHPSGPGGPPTLMGLTYVDEDGDDISISSNHELAVGIHYAMRLHQAQRGASAAGEATLRLTLHCNNPAPRQPQADMHMTGPQLGGGSDGSSAAAGGGSGGTSLAWPADGTSIPLYPAGHK